MIVRKAKKEDVNAIISLINELAKYENMSDQVDIDEAVFTSHLFEKQLANALVTVSDDDKIVGYAIYFYSFSTFLGRAGIYLEDLYIKPEFRGKKAGLAMIKELAEICEQEGYGRLEWECLDWNEPSIKFYENLGAKKQSGWIKFRITKEDMIKLTVK
ncbi:GNAT family N-acetyltransferase [Campylobacter sp. RM13119]|uniref:GNAT family N-acetyltransferase n=1 Tax=Campylobacter californiensis TaxID=1032243 RepID=UPI001472EA2B|nr:MULTISPECIES: GNAT family N-acetyltransferase [unclassified Campylobacter]MBE3606676.1 GNAT family N-acetyltransferase [Campylobacter sp. RM13119]MBE3610284.1 GNAT family N-acetyltransferase [Campylobacter sp. RM12916]